LQRIAAVVVEAHYPASPNVVYNCSGITKGLDRPIHRFHFDYTAVADCAGGRDVRQAMQL